MMIHQLKMYGDVEPQSPNKENVLGLNKSAASLCFFPPVICGVTERRLVAQSGRKTPSDNHSRSAR
jgi:hypothetical protein